MGLFFLIFLFKLLRCAMGFSHLRIYSAGLTPEQINLIAFLFFSQILR